VEAFVNKRLPFQAARRNLAMTEAISGQPISKTEVTMFHWVIDNEETHSARIGLGGKGVFNLIVGSLGEKGWDWHVWDRYGRMQQQYGFADTLCKAKAEAEQALERLVGHIY